METNQNILIKSTVEEPKQQSYDTLKAARIAETLRELLDPEYILLFGKLANGTPHSDILAYDLLAVTDGPAHYSWYDAKRYLKMKLPYIGHGAPYINLYIHTRHDIETRNVPFFYFARKEGIVLHSRSRKVARPRDKFDFGYAVSLAMKYSGIFMPLADKLAGYAERNLDRDHARESAYAMAQAAVYYYRTLFYVYHGFEADSCDVRYLHHRLRTLSGELPLLFESDEYYPKQTLHCLNNFATYAQYDFDFFVETDELARHLDLVKRLGEVARRLCERRMELYAER